MRAKTLPHPPHLLSLQGRIDNAVLEDAIAAIQRGDYPGWRIVARQAGPRKIGSPPWLLRAAAVVNLLVTVTKAVPMTSAYNRRTSLNARTLEVEYTPTGHRQTLIFENLGLVNGLPLWSRY